MLSQVFFRPGEGPDKTDQDEADTPDESIGVSSLQII
jgi:hypothetical protein